MTDGYLGNKRLKKPDTPIEWSQERMAEFMRCAEDPVYFAKNYIRIVHVDHGFIPLEMYDYQEEIVEKFHNNRRISVNQSRQSGKTTCAVAIILHYIIFNEYKEVAILSNKGASSKEVLGRIKLAYEALPKWLQHGILEWNKGNIELENGCKVTAGTTTSSSIRGGSFSFIYIDECAHINGWSEFYKSTYPTISSGETTKMLMTSTPNGLDHFYVFCKGAKEGTNGFAYVEVPWYRVPGRDEKWKEETLQALNYDYDTFEQEYNCSFIGASNTLINSDSLKNLVPTTPEFSNEEIKQFKKPEKDRVYVLIADVSRGKGLDYSTFSVIDVTDMPYEQVCTFRDNMVGPVDYANVIYRVGRMYNNAHILVEINDIGEQVSDTLFMDLGYEEMLFTENAGRSGKRISGGFGSKVDKGIRTTKSVKTVGCSIMKLMIEQDQLIINDSETILELKNFVKSRTSFEAKSGSHDDMVMTLVLFSWLSDQNYFQDLTDINTLQHLREKTDQQLEDEMLPMGVIDDGRDEGEKGGFKTVNWF